MSLSHLSGRIACSLLLPALVVPSLAVALAGDRAVERNGNVFVLRADGRQVQVTWSGADSQPDLALDGSKVVFVRKPSAGACEIWIADLAGDSSARPLVKGPLDIHGRGFDQFYTPRFSPDAARVYFLVQYAGTTNGIIGVDVVKPDPEFVAAAHNFLVVSTGKYSGHLVAQIRKAKLAPGYYDWYWLLTPQGKEVGIVGQDERDVALFMEMYQ